MQKEITIYIFGNPLIECDSLPLQILPDLAKKFPQINFVEIDPNENLKPINKEIIIIDTVINIEKVTIIKDIDKLETQDMYSAHDLDLAFFLKLWYKLGKLKRATIFGVPPKMENKRAFNQISDLIEDFLKN